MGGKAGATGGALSSRLESRAGQLLRGTKGVRKQILGQAEEALKTGGVGAQTPLVQRAIEGQKSATSKALQLFGEKSGLAGTPFGERIRSQIAQTGALAQAQTPIDLAQEAIQRGLGITQLQSQLAGQLFGGVGGLQQAMTGAAAQLKAQKMAGIQKALMGK